MYVFVCTRLAAKVCMVKLLAMGWVYIGDTGYSDDEMGVMLLGVHSTMHFMHPN